MIPNPEPSLPAIPWPNEIVAGFETAMRAAGAIAVMAVLILACLLVYAYYAETHYGRGRALTSYTLLLGVAVLAALIVSLALDHWGYFIAALVIPFMVFGGRWAIVSFLNRPGY